MRRAAVVVIAAVAATVLASCTVEVAGNSSDTAEPTTTAKGSASSDSAAITTAIIGTWKSTKLDGRDIVPEVDNIGDWSFTDTTLSVGDAESSCVQPYTLSDISSDGMRATLTRNGPATWTGLFASSPEPLECPFGYNMPAKVSINGDNLTIVEGRYDPPASGGMEHDPKTVEFERKS